MTRKNTIRVLYYEKKLNTIEISKKLKVSKQYISKVLNKDDEYIDEKNRRKEENLQKRKEKNADNTNITRAIKKEYNTRLDAAVELQHRQASCDMSKKGSINNRAFRNWNSSIYEFYESTKEYRLKKDFKNKVSYAVPKKIKWD